MKRVVVYCRVSTDHEDQKNSLENQRLYFEEYVKQHKDWKLVEIYADEGISGTSLKKRADFNRMYRDRLKNKYDIVLTKEVCRFARNTVDTLEKTRELKKLGIEVRFIIDNISTFDTDGELRLTIMAGLAQDESRRISERVQFGVIQSMKKGVAFGNIVYGYDFVRDPITGKKTKLVINEKEAKMRGFEKNRFSFNVKGGRCEACRGDGVKKIEMHFLPDVYVPCEICHGTRYNSETLSIKYKDKSIADVLNMRVSEALKFFENIPKIKNKLQVLEDVGLGYITLGQSAPTLSGGEAERVKLAKELQKKATGKTLFVLDEPTTGLHMEDIKRLLAILQKIVDNKDTVLVIEHNLDVIKVADYIIDLGPEGGDQGGEIVATGTPEEVMQNDRSYTGKFLKKIMQGE